MTLVNKDTVVRFMSEQMALDYIKAREKIEGPAGVAQAARESQENWGIPDDADWRCRIPCRDSMGMSSGFLDVSWATGVAVRLAAFW